MASTPKTLLTARDLGRLMHGMRREIARMFGDGNIPADWDDCSEADRASSERSALAMLAKPDMSAEEEHDRWMAERAAQGWTYGPERANARKLHPMMIPFRDLPPGEQLKDIVRIAMIRELRQYTDLSDLP